MELDSPSFQTTFAFAVSKEKIYGIIGSTDIIDGASIRHYVKELFKDRIENESSDKMPFIIWMDNPFMHAKGFLSKFFIVRDFCIDYSCFLSNS